MSPYIEDEEIVAQMRRAIQRLALFDEPMIHKTAWLRAGFTDAQIATFGQRAVRYERLRRKTMRVRVGDDCIPTSKFILSHNDDKPSPW